MIRVLDEAVDIVGWGVALILEEGQDPPPEGSVLVDARGNRHTLCDRQEQDGLLLLLLEGGDAAYFQRLFRDVLVDATAFELAED